MESYFFFFIVSPRHCTHGVFKIAVWLGGGDRREKSTNSVDEYDECVQVYVHALRYVP